MPLWERVEAYLDAHPGVFTYGGLAEALYPSEPHAKRTHSQGVGSAMRAICARGHHEFCPRVVVDETGKPGANCPG
jgi:hypothetical protein